MERAVATRHVIGEAMGILMGRHHVTEKKAFDMLRHSSQVHNVKPGEVARRMCEEGNLP